jgi:hypothetical protein
MGSTRANVESAGRRQYSFAVVAEKKMKMAFSMEKRCGFA